MVIPIQWYKAAPGAPSLGFPTSFMSLDWLSSTDTREQPNYQDQPWEQRPGEVFGEARPYTPRPVPIGLNYAHVCGTPEEFVDGAGFDPFREVEYDEQGLPLCCRGPIVPVFPLVLGFEAELEPPVPPPGFSCHSGGPVELGIWYTVTVGSTGVVADWWTWDDLITGDNYRMQCELLTNTGGFPVSSGTEQGNPCEAFAPPVNNGVAAPGVIFDEVRQLTTVVNSIGVGISTGFSVPSSTYRFRCDHVP